MTTQIAEPFSPVIDGQLLTDQPGNLVSRGELRPYTPVFFSLQTDEGRDRQQTQETSGSCFLFPKTIEKCVSRFLFRNRNKKTYSK